MKFPELVEEALGTYKSPFKYDPEGMFILDADNNLVLDVRGWGRFQQLKDTEVEALKLHDTIGELIVEALNERWALTKEASCEKSI